MKYVSIYISFTDCIIWVICKFKFYFSLFDFGYIIRYEKIANNRFHVNYQTTTVQPLKFVKDK